MQRLTATESQEQIALFRWAEIVQNSFPEIAMLFHIPNGGKRDFGTAKRLKLEGVKAGVPDLCLPVARDGYHGLYIELKAGRNKTTPEQSTWLVALMQQGYKTAVCYGWESASELIVRYLKGVKHGGRA